MAHRKYGISGCQSTLTKNVNRSYKRRGNTNLNHKDAKNSNALANMYTYTTAGTVQKLPLQLTYVRDKPAPSSVFKKDSRKKSVINTLSQVQEQQSRQQTPKQKLTTTPLADLLENELLTKAENMMFGANGETKNEKGAFEYIAKIAKRNTNARALGLLGFCYDFGIGCVPNSRRCERAYNLAANKGDTLAMSQLACLRSLPAAGIYMDRQEGQMWLNKIYEDTERSNPATINKNLAKYKAKYAAQEYKIGQGPLKWLWWAASELTNAFAQFALGNCFVIGAGTERNLKLAAKWYRFSAWQGCARGQSALGLCYMAGIGVKINHGKSIYWQKQAASNGETMAMYNLGTRYEDGHGVPQNKTIAYEWYVRGAQGRNGWAANALGTYHEQLLGGDYNEKIAVHWYYAGARFGCPWAEENMARIYTEGIGVPKDEGLAAYWLERAASHGIVEAQNRIGIAYDNGRGVEKNQDRAVYWYRLAADQGYIPACINLASCLEHGIGGPFDPAGALDLVERAMRFGYEKSSSVSAFEWATSLAKRVSENKISQEARRKIDNGNCEIAQVA